MAGGRSDLLVGHGFSAAWSEPLISKDGEVLGTFAMHYPEPRTPQSTDLELMDAVGHVALIAIELERSHQAPKNALIEIRDSENRLKTIIDTMPALAWAARPDGSAEFFNRRWLDYAGLSAEEVLRFKNAGELSSPGPSTTQLAAAQRVEAASGPYR